MENVDFILCFTVFFAFPWKCSISESINVSADKLGVCPRRKMINLHLPWMAKNAFNIFPIGIAVSYIFQFLLISTKCHNPLENHGRNEHHIFFIFAFPNLFFGMAMENVVFTLCFTVFYVFLWNGLINRTSIFIAEELDVCPCWKRKILHLPWMTKDVWNMLTIWSAVSFILVVRFRSRTCDNALENHGRNEERTFFIFMSTKAVWSSWQEREHHWFSHGAVAGRWGQSQDQDFYEYNRWLKDFYVPSGLWLLVSDLIFSAVFYLPGPGFRPRCLLLSGGKNSVSI